MQKRRQDLSSIGVMEYHHRRNIYLAAAVSIYGNPSRQLRADYLPLIKGLRADLLCL